MAAAPTTRWQRPVWTHRWDDDGAELPRGRYVEGVDELLVELVEPRLRGGGMLLIWFRQGRYNSGGIAEVWVPMRVAIQNEARREDGLRVPLSPITSRSLREVPLTFLLASAQEYASSVPFPESGRSADTPVTRLRESLAHSDLRRQERRDILDLYLDRALILARTAHPRNPTAWLARELGVSTATVRRWTAALRAR